MFSRVFDLVVQSFKPILKFIPVPIYLEEYNSPELVDQALGKREFSAIGAHFIKRFLNQAGLDKDIIKKNICMGAGTIYIKKQCCGAEIIYFRLRLLLWL